MANKVAFVLLAIAVCTVSADPWAPAPCDPEPAPCAQDLDPIPEPACVGAGPGLDGLAGAADLVPGDLAPTNVGPPTIRRLRTITIPGRRNHIIEHHSRPIWIRSAITRFVVPSAPVIVKPVLIHKPSSVSVKPNVISQGGATVPAPILLRIVKQIEQPATQRTLIVERPVPNSSCRIEAATALNNGPLAGAGGCGGLAGLGLAGLGGLGLGAPGCGCGTPLCNICG